MFRKSLLAATALVLCVTTAYAGQKIDRPSDRIVPRFMKLGVPMHVVHGYPVMIMDTRGNAAPGHNNVVPKYPNAIFDNIDWKDKNQEWLSYYGFTMIASAFCSYLSSQDHFCVSESGNNALAFYGTGKKAKKIGVPLFTETGSTTKYNVGIYSATASGLPGDMELAGGSTTASSNTVCCTQLRWVKAKVKLKAGKEYFLEVACGKNDPDACLGGWLMEETGQDYYHVEERETYNFGAGTHTFSFSSPWHASTGLGPAQGAAIIK